MRLKSFFFHLTCLRSAWFRIYSFNLRWIFWMVDCCYCVLLFIIFLSVSMRRDVTNCLWDWDLRLLVVWIK